MKRTPPALKNPARRSRNIFPNWLYDYTFRDWAVVALLTALPFLVGSIFLRSSSESPTKVDSNSLETQVSGNIEAHAAPLPIKSSGRLPMELQGLTVGVTYDEAIAVYPVLRQGGPKDDTELRGGPKPGGLAHRVYISHGRAIMVGSYLEKLRPSEASEFQNDVLLRLGKPDSDFRADPGVTNWVWIDGDLRVTFRSDSAIRCPPDARNISLELAYWPSYHSKPKSYTGTSEFLRRAAALSRDWESGISGEATSPVQPTKGLPRELAGVQLGIESSLASNVYSGMKIQDGGREGDSNVIRCLDQGLDSLCIDSWHDRVYKISQIRTLSQSAFESEGLRLLDRWFGSPASFIASPDRSQVFGYWTDGVTSFNQFMARRDNGEFYATTDVSDVAMQKEAQSAHCAERSEGYAQSPESKSLF
jgi:hypothetical protein